MNKNKVFIIGVTGGIGSKLGPLLLEAGHSVAGLHRKPEQARYLSELGIIPCLGDLMEMTAENLSELTNDSNVIVFTAGAAGSGVERTSEIDGEGVIKVIDAAKANGISRVYLVSAFMDAGRDLPMSEGFEHYMSVKRKADNALVASGLDWLILRPGALSNEHATGLVNANLAIPFGPVSRANVAAMLAALIELPQIRREIIELTDGDVSVQDAVLTIRR